MPLSALLNGSSCRATAGSACVLPAVSAVVSQPLTCAALAVSESPDEKVTVQWAAELGIPEDIARKLAGWKVATLTLNEGRFVDKLKGAGMSEADATEAWDKLQERHNGILFVALVEFFWGLLIFSLSPLPSLADRFVFLVLSCLAVVFAALAELSLQKRGRASPWSPLSHAFALPVPPLLASSSVLFGIAHLSPCRVLCFDFAAESTFGSPSCLCPFVGHLPSYLLRNRPPSSVFFSGVAESSPYGH